MSARSRWRLYNGASSGMILGGHYFGVNQWMGLTIGFDERYSPYPRAMRLLKALFALRRLATAGTHFELLTIHPK